MWKLQVQQVLLNIEFPDEHSQQNYHYNSYEQSLITNAKYLRVKASFSKGHTVKMSCIVNVIKKGQAQNSIIVYLNIYVYF